MKHFRKKGGAEDMPKYIMGFLVVMMLTAFAFYMISKSGAQAGTLTQLNFANKNNLCKAQGESILSSGSLEGNDRDKDGYPDDCDLCLGGDNSKVSNSYGIPNPCYTNPSTLQTNNKKATYEEMCKFQRGTYISSTEQCCLPGYNCVQAGASQP
jgi:hypothetical protein